MKPNVGDFKKYLRQIYHWYAYYHSQYPKGTAVARIVFPYNPYKKYFWSKTIGHGLPLEPVSEAWVEDEFWDFISDDKNSMAHIKAIFEQIKDEGILEKKFDALFN